MDINKFPSGEAIVGSQQYLNQVLENNKANDILLMLSGGSAFKLLDGIESELLTNKITISVLDERFSSDSTINNFLQLGNTLFFKKAGKCNFLSTVPKGNETVDDLAGRWEMELKSWKKVNPKGLIIITQGIGPDGHTAGIMPFPENTDLFEKLFNSDSWVVGYDSGSKNQYPKRVTVTNTFLVNEVNESIVYAVGNGKFDLVQKIKANEIQLADLPAGILNKMKVVKIYTE